MIRITYLILSKKSPFYQPLLLDPEYYHRWAERILAGNWVGDGVFYGLPLYPYFLALCYKVFHGSLLAVKVIQSLLGLVTLFFTFKIGERLFSKKAGILAIFLAAVYGPLFFHEGILIPETLSLPLYAAGFYFSIRFMEAPSIRKGIGLGFLLGLATLTKAGIIPFVFIFMGLMLVERIHSTNKSLVPLFSMITTFILTLAPVPAHNLIYGKDAVFLTSHSGFNFYIGNNPRAQGVFVAPEGTGSNVDTQIQDSKAVAEKESGRALKPSEVSKYWSDKAWDYIKENPVDFIKLSMRKFVLFFDAREISDVDDYVFCGNFNPMLRFPWLNFAVLGPLFFAGAFVCFRALRHKKIVYAWILAYVFGIVLFFVNARYRLPLLSIFFPLSAAAVIEIYESVKKCAWRRLLVFLAVLGMGVMITQARLVGTNWAGDYVNAGDAATKMKDYDLAFAFYKKAIEIDPRAVKANQAMGVLLSRTGNLDEAKQYYEKTLLLDPNNYQAHNNVGLWHYVNRDLARAKMHFLRAAELNPNSAQAHNNLGMIYGQAGDNGQAAKEFQHSLKLDPHNAKTHTNLGLIYHRLGKNNEALRSWEAALKIDPEFEQAKKAIQLLKR